jgi:hypothetical protein
MALLSDTLTQILIPVASLIGIAFALFQWLAVSRISVSASSPSSAAPPNPEFGRLLDDDGDDDDDDDDEEHGDLDDEEGSGRSREIIAKCAEIQEAISLGKWKSIVVHSISRNMENFSLQFFCPPARSSCLVFLLILPYPGLFPTCIVLFLPRTLLNLV